jgi:hypothetical protein
MPAYHLSRATRGLGCVPVRFRSAAFFAGALAAASGCGPRPGAVAAGEALCAERLPPAQFELPAAPAAEAPVSRVAVTVSASPRAIARELERQVPQTLADVRRQPVGAPGEASYRVRRGPLGAALSGERLFVTAGVVVDIEVCKPFGALCIRYGTCHPELSTSVSVPLVLGRDYGLGRARAAVELTRPCYILGNDVSGPIRDAARAQVGDIESRVNSALPVLGPAIAGAWKLLELPIALGPGTCVRIEPERVQQAKPRLVERAITTQLAVGGRVRVERPCAPGPNAPRPLPELELVAETPPGLRLEVPIQIGWDEVSAELSRSLSGAAGARSALRIVRARARATSRNARSALALEATLQGPICGDVTFVAEAAYDARASRIRLQRVALPPEQRQFAELAREYDLFRTIERDAAIALPVDVAAMRAALNGLLERASSARPAFVALRTALEPARVERVFFAPEALVAVATLAGEATVALE